MNRSYQCQWMRNAMSDYVRQISEVVDAIQQKLVPGAAGTGVIVNPRQSSHMIRKFKDVSLALVEHRSFFLNSKWQSILKEIFRLVTEAHNIMEECGINQAGDSLVNNAFLQVDNEGGFTNLLGRLKSTICLILDDELVCNAHHQRIYDTFQKLDASVCPPNKTAFKYDHEQLLVKLKDMVAARMSLQQLNQRQSFRAVHHLIRRVNRILERKTSELHDQVEAANINHVTESELYCVVTENSPLIFKDSDVVGVGSSGKLYRMEWSGVECVIKKFGPTVREEEAKLLASAIHPNIVRVICCLQDSGGTPIGILMELMPMSLDKFIKIMHHQDQHQDESDEFAPRSFTMDAIIDILWQIASAMKHLHQLGIVHLDLKPANVLVSPSRVPEFAREGYVRVAKLTDFGSAKRIDDSDPEYFRTPHFGTTRYRAPDHLTSSKIYPEKLDVYSFALLCWELLTGQIPFPDMECGKMGSAVGKNRERPALPADCPQDLAALIEKCWAHKPKDRPDPSQICDELLKVRARLLTHQLFRALSRSARSSEALIRVNRSRHIQTNCDPIDLSTKRAKLQEFMKSLSARLPSPSSMSVKRPHDASIHYWCGDEAFTYQELSVATKGFHSQNKLATPKEHTCKYGGMYKGTLKDTITRVAVRKIPTTVIDVECIRRISHIQHPNVAGLRGWCNNRENLLLVYEYMEKGNLKSMLQDDVEVKYLRWVVRRDILKGVASAVQYLHDDCGLVHQGVKASNILLGWDNNPHLRDSGLALLVPQNPTNRSRSITKKRGHLAPELWHYKEHTKETDVFSFGNLILEVVCGDVHPAHLPASTSSDGTAIRPSIAVEVHHLSRVSRFKVDGAPNERDCEWQLRKSSGCSRRFLHDYVWESYTKHCNLGTLGMWVSEIADPRLQGDFEVADVEDMLMLGLWCCHPDLSMRPSMSIVHQLLSADRIYKSPPRYHFHGKKKCRRSCPPLAGRPNFTKLYDQVPPKKPEVWYEQPGPPECSRSTQDYADDDHLGLNNHPKAKTNLDCPCPWISISFFAKYDNSMRDPRFA